MSEHVKPDTSSAPPQGEVDVVVLIQKMQQQLVFLEKKIDTLISQSSEKPFRRNHFSQRSGAASQARPFRSFGHSHPQGKGEHDNSSRERGFAPRRHFGTPQGGENRGFGQSQKPFFRPRKGRG